LANAVTRISFSGSTQGQAVLVVATATPGTLIHATGTSATVQDETRMYAYNSHTADVLLTIEYGGATAPNQNIVQTIPFKSGLIEITPPADMFLTGNGSAGLTVKAFAGTTNVITISGCVFRTTP
jgi:hypothetical protein